MSQGSGRTATRCHVCSLGGTNPSRSSAGSEVVAGDILLIRPGIEHTVICSGGINVMYLDGLQWSGDGRLAERLQGRLANLAIDAIFRGSDAQTALRQRLVSGATQFPPQLVAVIQDLIAEPMSRMTQRELSRQTAGGKDQGSSHVQGGHWPDISRVQAMVGAAARSPENRFGRTRQNGGHGWRLCRHSPSHPDVSHVFRTYTVGGDRRTCESVTPIVAILSPNPR